MIGRQARPARRFAKNTATPDFLLANDPWFRGLNLVYGPDGGVYVQDWTDTGECHNFKFVDQTKSIRHMRLILWIFLLVLSLFRCDGVLFMNRRRRSNNCAILS